MKNNNICSEFTVGNIFIEKNKYYDPVSAAIVGAAVAIGTGTSFYSAKQQAKAAKEASDAQIQAQQQASEQDKKMRQQQDINNAMSETAKTTYGAGADIQRVASASTDLLIPSTMEQNLGGIKNRTGLGF